MTSFRRRYRMSADPCSVPPAGLSGSDLPMTMIISQFHITILSIIPLLHTGYDGGIFAGLLHPILGILHQISQILDLVNLGEITAFTPAPRAG